MKKDEFPLVDKIREQYYRLRRKDAINEFLEAVSHVDGFISKKYVIEMAERIRDENE